MNEYYLVVAYILSGVFGLCVGSFLNVVIYRVPEKMSLASPASHCPKCGYVLKWYDNIPILSYIILGGRCRSCRDGISFRYTAVEIANTLLWLGCVFTFWKVSIPYACLSAAVCSVLLCVFFTDLEHMIIPDRYQLILLALAVAMIFFNGLQMWYSHLIGAAAAAVIFIGVAYFGGKVFGKEALGGGDIKLGIIAGLMLGWEKLIVAMLIATVSASIILIILKCLKKNDRGTEYPFAPFITAGMAAALFFGDTLIDLYLSLIYSAVSSVLSV